MSEIYPAFGNKSERSTGIYDAGNRNLGPGQYAIEEKTSSFSKCNLERARPKWNWHQQYLTEQNSEMPRVLYKPQKEEQLEQVKRLGPGKYEVAKAFEFFDAKPSSRIGPINNLSARFKVDSYFVTPPPNYYTADGSPHDRKERLEAKLKNASLRGFCETRDQTERVLRVSDSGLPPSLYNIKPYTDQLIAKRISTRGPYDLTTGPRCKSVEPHSVPVGAYDLPSTIDRLKHRAKKWNGTFLRSSQYPKQSNITQIGPCSYKNDYKPEKHSAYDHNGPAFLVGASRDNNSAMKPQRSLTGPGRYNSHIMREPAWLQSCKSVFDSKSAFKPSLERESLLKERIRGKRSKLVVTHSNYASHLLLA